ncbi:complement component receptor 1-like protein isoform X2 [Hemitrygon akajei]|uniref:complement component receptor 1-like protein isoform X2 n=1 Tax=Hemitrygon akajei TaxID=2704970 RepID=UPI003BFA0D7F
MFLKAALKLALLFVLQICPTLEDCSTAPHISNAEVTTESTSWGSKARYSCHPGYVLSGHTILTCTDGVWTKEKPRCTEKSCGSPGEILNGRYNATGNTFGAVVTFYCDEGYQIVGRGSRLCDVDGWSGDVPSCQPVTCADLPSIANGFEPTPPYGEYWESGSVAKFSCIGDYSLIGAKSLICLSSGRWSDDPPTCRDVRCFIPDAPINGRIRSSPRNVLRYEEEVLFECDRGFEIVGSNLIKCNENSQFSDDPPTCRFNGCKKPQSIANGLIKSDKEIYTKHETVTFTCRSGYKLIGSETLHCRGYNEYDKPSPECRAIRCQSPSPIPNGGYARRYSTGSFYNYGDVITFTCNKGFKLEGSSESRCGDNGVFNPHPPTCRRVQCERPRNLNNANIQPDHHIYYYEEYVTFSCHPGYIPTGSIRSLCVGRGSFDPPPPTCKKDNSEWTISKTAHGEINTIILWSQEIINVKKDIIQMEHRLLQKEESILLKYQAIVQNLEILLNRTSIPKAA